MPFLPYNDFIHNKPMTTINKQHWDDLYAKLHDAYAECLKHHNPTYEQKIAVILDHMIENKKWFNIR